MNIEVIQFDSRSQPLGRYPSCDLFIIPYVGVKPIPKEIEIFNGVHKAFLNNLDLQIDIYSKVDRSFSVIGGGIGASKIYFCKIDDDDIKSNFRNIILTMQQNASKYINFYLANDFNNYLSNFLETINDKEQKVRYLQENRCKNRNEWCLNLVCSNYISKHIDNIRELVRQKSLIFGYYSIPYHYSIDKNDILLRISDDGTFIMHNNSNNDDDEEIDRIQYQQYIDRDKIINIDIYNENNGNNGNYASLIDLLEYFSLLHILNKNIDIDNNQEFGYCANLLVDKDLANEYRASAREWLNNLENEEERKCGLDRLDGYTDQQVISQFGTDFSKRALLKQLVDQRRENLEKSNIVFFNDRSIRILLYPPFRKIFSQIAKNIISNLDENNNKDIANLFRQKYKILM